MWGTGGHVVRGGGWACDEGRGWAHDEGHGWAHVEGHGCMRAWGSLAGMYADLAEVNSSALRYQLSVMFSSEVSLVSYSTAQYSSAVIYKYHNHNQQAFRNKSHTSHSQRPGLKQNTSK